MVILKIPVGAAALPRLVGLPRRDPARGGAAGLRRPRFRRFRREPKRPAARAAAATGPTRCRCPTARPAGAPAWSTEPGPGARPRALSSRARLAAQRPLEVGDQVLGGLDPAREPHQVGRARRRRSPRPTGGSSPAGPRSATPPRRATRRGRRSWSASRSRVASGWRKETMPPKPGQRTSSTPRRRRSQSLTARPFSVWRATRSASVRSPRWTRKQSNGPGTAPTEFWTKRTRSCRSASRAITVAPPTTSECPPRYLVVEWTTAVAPSSSGRWTIGRREGVVDDHRRPSPRPRRPRRCRPRSAAGWSASRPRSGGSRARSAARSGVDVGLVDEVVGEPEAGQHLVDQPVGAAVEVDAAGSGGRRRRAPR